ncbi:hypothetical protein Tco_1468013 [Tanacetum coccineum]
MVIYNALPRKEYERIFMCNTAKEIWKILLITHQGNSQVKDNKIDLLVQQYEQFVISEDESIDSAFARFNTFITSLKALDEGYSSKNYVRKFIRALHLKWRAKVTTIEESKDLTSLSLNELIGNLKCSTSESEEEEYAIAIRDFKKFFKKRGRCGDPNHLIGECPKPSKDKNERAFVRGSWSNSGEEDDEKAKDKTCLMAQASSEICTGIDLEPGEWIKDSGCSKYMTGNRKLFSTYKAYNRGNVIFGSNLRGNIIGKESLNVTLDETPPPSKTSPLVDDELDKEEAIKITEKKKLENDIEDETLEVDEILNIKESKNHPLGNVIGNLNQITLRFQVQNQGCIHQEDTAYPCLNFIKDIQDENTPILHIQMPQYSILVNTPYPKLQYSVLVNTPYPKPQYSIFGNTPYSKTSILCIRQYSEMNDPNITIEEYIRLETEKALRKCKVYIWESATYGKIRYDEVVYFLRSVETEFLAIVYNDALTYELELSCEPTVSPQHISKVNWKIEIPLSDFDDENFTIIYDNDSFSYKIFKVDDLKLDMGNGDDKIDIKQSLGDLSIEPLPNVINTDVGTFAHSLRDEAGNKSKIKGILYVDKSAVDGMETPDAIFNLFIDVFFPGSRYSGAFEFRVSRTSRVRLVFIWRKGVRVVGCKTAHEGAFGFVYRNEDACGLLTTDEGCLFYGLSQKKGASGMAVETAGGKPQKEVFGLGGSRHRGVGLAAGQSRRANDTYTRIFITARVFLEGTLVMGTKGFFINARVFLEGLTYELELSCEPTVSPQHISKVNWKIEIPLSDFVDENFTIIYDNDSFSYKIFNVNDLKLDMGKGDDKIDIKQSLGDLSIEPLSNVINTDVGTSA